MPMTRKELDRGQGDVQYRFLTRTYTTITRQADQYPTIPAQYFSPRSCSDFAASAAIALTLSLGYVVALSVNVRTRKFQFSSGAFNKKIRYVALFFLQSIHQRFFVQRQSVACSQGVSIITNVI